MHKFKILCILLATIGLSGCTMVQRTVHLYSSDAPSPKLFSYNDGGSSIYYSFNTGAGAEPETFVFFYGGSGCASWKSVMPNYVDGLTVNARVFVLNKRYVDDRSMGLFGCGKQFEASDNPTQWFSDYAEFVSSQLRLAQHQPKNVVLVGVSEGGLVASKVATQLPDITQVAIIGHGGYTLRKSIRTLVADGRLWLNPDNIWKKVQSDPTSLEKRTTGHPYKYWSEVMDYDPLPNYLSLQIPVIIGIGELDKSIPVESARFLEAKFKETGKTNLTLKVYPGAGHRLRKGGVSYRSDFFLELSRLLQPAQNALQSDAR